MDNRFGRYTTPTHTFTVKAVCIGGTPFTAMTIQGTKTMVYSN